MIGLCSTLKKENLVIVVALRKLSAKGRNYVLWLTTLIGDWQEQKPFVPNDQFDTSLQGILQTSFGVM